MFRRSKSKESKKEETHEGEMEDSIHIEQGENIVIGGLDGTPIQNIPAIAGHPEINTQLSKAHEGVFLQKGENGELRSFYLDPRASEQLEEQYEELQDDRHILTKELKDFMREMKKEVQDIKENISRKSSQNSSKLTSTSTTTRGTREPSREKEKRQIPHRDIENIRSNLNQGLMSQKRQTQEQDQMPDISRQMQIFSKNKTMYENLPKLEASNKSHFKRYLEDMELQFLVWKFPDELLIPISIQRCYSELRSDLLRKFKEGKIKNKNDLSKYLAKLCLKGESYTGIKEKYILSNKMTESQLDFSTLYQTITSKQVEHLISLDKTLASSDHKRERTRLAVEIFKASIHPNVLAHCQALGKADDIEDLLTTSNDFAQSQSTKKQNSLLAYEKKRVNQFSTKDDEGSKDLAELMQRVMQFSKEKPHTRQSRPQQRPFWCKYCIPNKLDKEQCKHCWKHSDLSRGVIRSECSQCKYWNQKKQSAENWKDKQQRDKDYKSQAQKKSED
jgi:hypothetical protein